MFRNFTPNEVRFPIPISNSDQLSTFEFHLASAILNRHQAGRRVDDIILPSGEEAVMAKVNVPTHANAIAPAARVVSSRNFTTIVARTWRWSYY